VNTLPFLCPIPFPRTDERHVVTECCQMTRVLGDGSRAGIRYLTVKHEADVYTDTHMRGVYVLFVLDVLC